MFSSGAPIDVGQKFCGGCGAALTIGAPTMTPSPAHVPLLAEKIRPPGEATVEGRRRAVVGPDAAGSPRLLRRDQRHRPRRACGSSTHELPTV